MYTINNDQPRASGLYGELYYKYTPNKWDYIQWAFSLSTLKAVCKI